MRNLTLKIITTSLFALTNITGGGIPACPYTFEYTQPDSTVISVLQIGDEHSHCYCTVDKIPIAKDNTGFFRYIESPDKKKLADYVARNPEQRTRQEKSYIENLSQNGTFKSVLQKIKRHKREKPAAKSLDFPNTGEVRGLIILAEYTNLKFSSTGTKERFQAQMNQAGYSENGATGSARDYFIDQSNGTFFPYFDIVGPITLPHEMAYYGENDFYGNDLNLDELIVDACLEADKTCGTDFSEYDYDNDGAVDLVYVIYAGYAESNNAPENTIWPSAGSLEEFGVTINIDGKKISTFACSSELNGRTGTELSGIGTFCHEFSHCLGLPDLYNTEYGDTFGMGTWSIMDMGSYNNDSKTPAGFSAFERYSCGWLTPKELQEMTADVELQPLNTSNQAYIIRSPFNENEFFTLENRQQTGWDTYLPGHGLMIVHIDYDEAAWSDNTVNNTAGHERVQIVPADGNFTTPEGDLYPGTIHNTYFTDDSEPAAKLYTGGKLNKPIIEIREQGETILFHFLIDRLETPSSLGVSNHTETELTATWDAIDQAESYTLVYAEQYPENTELINETFQNFTEGTPLMPSTDDISTALDNFTSQAGWTGSQIGQSGGNCYLKAKGHIVTPQLDFSGDGTFTIEFDAQSNRSYYDGITITIGESNDFSETSTTIVLNSPSRKERICQTFSTSIDKGYIKIESVSNLSISNLTVYSGQKSESEKTGMPLHGEPVIIEGITENHYDINIPNPDKKYLFKVQAKNQYTSSPFSSKFKIDKPGHVTETEQSSGRFITTSKNTAYIHGIPGDRISIISISGQTVYSGIIQESVCTKSLRAGMYLIRIGEYTFKTTIL